jgi:enoyl-[acyl-carrier protein] reductase II
MIWCSGWELASAVSNAGGLGLIGSGSMYPDILREHIRKCKAATDKPFGVNLPLIYPQVADHVQVILDEGVKIVFTSAGNPAKYTAFFEEKGLTVAHVVANTKFAKKCEEAGVDAIVAEGFEAGGHNGTEETTTMTLIPMVREVTDLPLIAAGGIGTGRSMLAAFALGADGVQIGSRFAASEESSAHPEFKRKILEAKDGDTALILKKIIPVRLIKNKFHDQVKELENQGANREHLMELLGHGRAKKGMFEGNIDEGELEIGQVSGLIHELMPAARIVEEIVEEFEAVRRELGNLEMR